MHESGVIEKVLDLALSRAAAEDAQLCGIRLRLGALAGGSEEHLREHFNKALAHRRYKKIQLEIDVVPEYPGGVELLSIELRTLSLP